MPRLIAACLVVGLLLAGCSSTGGGSPLQVTDDLVAAKPATAPPVTRPPRGAVHPAPAAQHTAFDATTGTVVVASASPPRLTLFDTSAMRSAPRTVPLPAPAAELRVTGAGAVRAPLPEADLVARVDLRTGAVTRIPVPGAPVSVVAHGDRLVVARRDRHDVAVVEHGRVVRTVGGFRGPARLVRRGGEVVVLDRLTTSLQPVELAAADKGAALRAGEGATHAVADRYGRVLVVDTRGEEIMAFTTDPLIMKQRYPVPGSPYGLAYDPARDLAWVTLTQRNELVAYDIRGGEPTEKYRVPTVHQPNSVAVDPRTGKVYVASATGRGLQVVQP